MSIRRSSEGGSVPAPPILDLEAKSGDFTAAVGERGTTFVCSAALAVTLPAASDNAALWYRIVNASAGVVTVPAVPLALVSRESVTVASDGTSWHVIESHLRVGQDSVDRPPASPHADNDEFAHATLNAAWTESLTGTPTVDVDTTLVSHYTLSSTGTGKASKLTKSVTVSGDATWLVKFRGAHITNFSNVHFGLYSSDEANAIYMDWLHATQQSVRLLSLDASVETARATVVLPVNVKVNTLYLYLKRASDVWSVRWSFDGGSWFAVATTHNKAFTVAKMIVQLRSDSQSTPQRLALDYVRRDAVTLG